MRRNVSWKQITTLFFTVGCLIVMIYPAAHGAVQNLSGDFTNYFSSKAMWYVDIPFSIGSHSEVAFEYYSLCENPEDLHFYLRVAERADNTLSETRDYHIASGNGITQPIEEVPLNQGHYIAQFTCRGLLTSPPDPEWTLKVTSTPISLSYAEDREPESEEPVTVGSTRSFIGWLGLWGTPSKIQNAAINGHDVYDTHILNMKKGSKLKFKLEWGDFKTTTADPVHFGVLFYRYRDGQTYYVDTFPSLENSGDITKEISLLEDGLYKVSFGGPAAGFFKDRKRYGGYKATVIINGEAEPYVEIDGIKSITTSYRDGREWHETDKLLLGEESRINVLIINNSPKTIDATLSYGLSVRGANPVFVGRTKLLLPASIAIPMVYDTTLTTPADTPIAITGELVMLLTDNTNTLLDKLIVPVKIWGPQHGVVVQIAARLLLKEVLVE